MWHGSRVTDFAPTMLQLADGRTLQLWLAGPEDGIPLVFHSGSPSIGSPYPHSVAKAGDRGLRWVGMARPGYGSSTRQPGRTVASVAADVAQVLDHLGAERSYTMGESGGGPHALATAALLPDRVLGAATLGSVGPFNAAGLDWLAGMGAENITEFGAAVTGPDALQRWLETDGTWVATVTGADVAKAYGDLVDDVDRAALTGEYADWEAACLRACVSSGFWGWFDDDMAFIRDWGFDLGVIQPPVAIWQGEHDRMVPFAHGVWLAEHVHGARAELRSDQGHLSLAQSAFGEILDDLIAHSA